MNEFEQNNFEDNAPEEVKPEQNIPENPDREADNAPFDVVHQETPQTPPPFTPPYSYPHPSANPVRYTEVYKGADSSSSSKGLKVFCITMAILILLTGTALAGFLLGKRQGSGSSPSELYSDVKVDLATKPENTDQYTPAQVYEKLNKSIVGIRVYNENGSMSDASGVIYTADGYIITNDHIYSSVGAPKFKIYMYDGTEYDASYVAGDLVSDLAVLKINGGSDFVPAVMGDSNELFCGENVVTLGRPSGASDYTTITSGIISLTARRISNTSSYSSSLIQTDSAINPGSSGGALVNMYGQVIGITSSKIVGTDYDAIGFAIPSRTVNRIVTQLISDGKVTDRAKLGITYTELDSVKAEISGSTSSGLYVATVSQDSPLHGKVVEGDIITEINGKKITSDDVVLDIIEASRPGDVISITVIDSKGNTSQFEAELIANVGESSYKEKIEDKDGDNSSNGGTFNFPFGE